MRASPWKKTPVRISLSPEHVDIWSITLDLPQTQIDEYFALLSPREVARARRYKVQRKHREYIISRGLLRRILGQALKIEPVELVFAYTEHDKPVIELTCRGLPVCFNVTHSHERTLIAVTLGHAIGIDVEYIRPDVQFRQLARRFFSAQEARELESYTETGLPRAFFACWTRKEAYVKALGDGIAFGLNEFSVSVNPYDDAVALATHWDPDEAGNWLLMNLPVGADYIAAVAVAGVGLKLRYWKL